jgi:DNA-binding XRE family transcriptional regulator
MVMKDGVHIENNRIKNITQTNNSEYYYRVIGKNIKKFRKENRLTQQNLADMTDLSREYICDIENEKRNKHLTIKSLGKIAEALKMNIIDFFK